MTAERLYADNGTDDVAVNVDVTGFDAVADVVDSAFDTAVYTAGQSIAFGVDLVDELIQFAGTVADNVQYRTEHFALQLVQVVQFKQDWTNEGRVVVINVGGSFDFVVSLRYAFHFVDVGQQVLLGFSIDDRADVCGQLDRFADNQLVHCTFDDVDHFIGNIFLNTQDTQGGTTLTRAVEGRVQYVEADLFRQGGRVHDHRVLTACFGNQDRAVVAFGQGFVDQARYFGRTGEDHAADAGIAGQGGADITCAEYELQRRSRNTGLMHQGNCVSGNQAGLFGRFGDNGVTGCQCRNDFAGKDGQWEVPWADGNDCADGFGIFRQGVLSFVGIVAAEVNGFAYFGNGVVQGFTGFADGQHHQCRRVLFQQIGKTAQAVGAF